MLCDFRADMRKILLNVSMLLKRQHLVTLCIHFVIVKTVCISSLRTLTVHKQNRVQFDQILLSENEALSTRLFDTEQVAQSHIGKQTRYIPYILE